MQRGARVTTTNREPSSDSTRNQRHSGMIFGSFFGEACGWYASGRTFLLEQGDRGESYTDWFYVRNSVDDRG